MNLILAQILISPFIFFTGTLLYFVFRDKMAKKDGHILVSKYRVLRIILLNFLNNFLATSYLITIFFTLSKSFSLNTLLIFLFFPLVIFFGNGIYITSILLVSYVDKHKEKPDYKIASDFLHGSVSHLLIYQSYFILVSLLALIENNSLAVSPNLFEFILILVSGVVVGLTFFWSHVHNTTIKHQLYPICIVFSFTLLFLVKSNFVFSYWTIFYFVFSLTFIFFGLLYTLFPSKFNLFYRRFK